MGGNPGLVRNSQIYDISAYDPDYFSQSRFGLLYLKNLGPSPAYTYRGKTMYDGALSDDCVGTDDLCSRSERTWIAALNYFLSTNADSAAINDLQKDSELFSRIWRNTQAIEQLNEKFLEYSQRFLQARNDYLGAIQRNVKTPVEVNAQIDNINYDIKQIQKKIPDLEKKKLEYQSDLDNKNYDKYSDYKRRCAASFSDSDERLNCISGSELTTHVRISNLLAATNYSLDSLKKQIKQKQEIIKEVADIKKHHTKPQQCWSAISIT